VRLVLAVRLTRPASPLRQTFPLRADRSREHVIDAC
jgi:hypothetical protein